jgi:4-diphosphocytidyl-2-C-methyl-D-erythritol kinase
MNTIGREKKAKAPSQIKVYLGNFAATSWRVGSVTLLSPAKINLFLAVTGRRPDGFHELVSLVAPLDFGDELAVGEKNAATGSANRFTLECDHPAVPRDGSNLILKAAEAYAAATGWKGGAHFKLTKRIPIGAGLGGGSSNAVAALRALNQLAGGRLSDGELAGTAAKLGSDCALFLSGGPVIMRGRGDVVEAVPEAAARRLRGLEVLLFKPSFGVSTAWAYARMAARGSDYLPAGEASERLARWLGRAAPAGELLFNNMEPAAGEKYPALPLLLEKLQARGVAARMSGSGSACFAVLNTAPAADDIAPLIRAAWGTVIFVQKARIS